VGVGLALAVAVGGARAGMTGERAAACGPATLATLAAADATVLTDIYHNELAGTEVSFDLANVTGAADLLRAVARDKPAATLRAVHRIVFHPGWHIVRLRVMDASGRILADVGGPYVIAPVSGTLVSTTGAVVGSFLMSVQDDVGITKLETRFVGDPIAIYIGGRLIAQRDGDFPLVLARGSTVTRHGVSYRVVAQTDNAFPTGTLRAVILVAAAPASLRRAPCATVRAAEIGRVAVRITHLTVPLRRHYLEYATAVQTYTGSEVFIREHGTQLASSGGVGPAVLPMSGIVSYQGVSWLVFSFEPLRSTRVYVLIPPVTAPAAAARMAALAPGLGAR